MLKQAYWNIFAISPNLAEMSTKLFIVSLRFVNHYKRNIIFYVLLEAYFWVIFFYLDNLIVFHLD